MFDTLLLRYFFLFITLFLVLRYTPLARRYPRASLIFLYVWVFSFSLHFGVVYYLEWAYQASPDAYLVLSAVYHTTWQEAMGYIAQSLTNVIYYVVGVGVLLPMVVYALYRWHLNAQASYQPYAKLGRGQRCLVWLMVICMVALVAEPYRKRHPWVYWARWADKLSNFKGDVQSEALVQQQIQQQVLAQNPTTSLKRNMVMLVIEESVNRDNMQLYGYSRATTPKLMAKRNELLVMQSAYSANAATQDAINNLLTSMQYPGQQPHWSEHLHLLSMAKQAGYHITWITNQNDPAIRMRYAKHAHKMVETNQQTGRRSQQLDDVVLKHVAEALANDEPLRLIVVHLMGAHPHYRLRHTSAQHGAFSHEDTVVEQMRAAGRSNSVIATRLDYDRAVLYQDGILAGLLNEFQRSAATEKHASWLMVSDHGQEIGHSLNFAGHNPRVESGYKVPIVAWSKQGFALDNKILESRYVRTDLLDWGLLDLLHINLVKDYALFSVFSPFYKPPPSIQPWTNPQKAID